MGKAVNKLLKEIKKYLPPGAFRPGRVWLLLAAAARIPWL